MAGMWLDASHLEACPDIGPACGTPTPPPDEWHDLHLLLWQFRFEGEYTFTEWLSVDALVPFRVTDVFFQLEDAASRQPIAGSDIHHRSETLVGIGDPWLTARATHAFRHLRLGVRAGLTIPLGTTVPNPFALGAMGLSHEHIQYGDGTFDPVLGADAAYPLGSVTLDAFFLARLALYANGYGYRAGNRFLGGLLATLPVRAFSFTAGVDLFNEQAETWSGALPPEGNLGRTDLLADLRIAWRLASSFTARLGARLPLYSQMMGVQLSAPALVELSIEERLRL